MSLLERMPGRSPSSYRKSLPAAGIVPLVVSFLASSPDQKISPKPQGPLRSTRLTLLCRRPGDLGLRWGGGACHPLTCQPGSGRACQPASPGLPTQRDVQPGSQAARPAHGVSRVHASGPARRRGRRLRLSRPGLLSSAVNAQRYLSRPRLHSCILLLLPFHTQRMLARIGKYGGLGG